jgi:hypothetical protein
VECRPPKGGVIELVSVLDLSRPFAQEVAACVKERHGGLFALVLHAPDPVRTMARLTDLGCAPPDGPSDQAIICGTRFIIE